MSHEIYYTSAPEGLKRGTSGFCTVAASENIPKALWDRLESLSAYRHLSGVGAAGENPVSYAHWILTVTGKTHHVLSRVCDSGVDHTQRSNAFAHHRVLEGEELARAAGGPAWLLQQKIMTTTWDGIVGTLASAPIPGGTGPVPGICREWEAVTGDAGWGGHLADMFVQSPTRPVCLLFAPGQEILPLLAESIALLPPTARWNVTFNTFFTSMPTSATCLWRCCAVGTQAADIGRRYAANGLILNLAEAARMGRAPDGPLAAVARSGAVTVSRNVATVAAPSPRWKESPATADPVRSDAQEIAPEPPQQGVIDFAEMPQERASDDAGQRVRQRTALPPRMALRAQEALEEAETAAAAASARRRKQVLVLVVAAIGAIGLGTGIIIAMARHGAPPEPAGQAQAPAPEPIEMPVFPNTEPPAEVTPQTPAALPSPPQTARFVPPAPAPIVPPPVVYPTRLTTYTALEAPVIGTGIGDRSQAIGVSKTELDPSRVTGLRLQLPVATATSSGTPASSFEFKDLGTFSARSASQGMRPALQMLWKGPQDVSPVQVGTVQWDADKAQLDFQWHAALLLKYQGMFNAIYWLLVSSTIELQSARAEKQQVQLKPFVPPVLEIAATQSAIAWPVPLPLEAVVMPPAAQALPPGWTAERYFDWPTREASARTPENALQVIKFKKETGVSIADAIFTVTFHPGLTKIECDFARQVADHDRDLKRFESELRVIDQNPDIPQYQEKKAETVALVDAYKQALAGYNELTRFELTFELPEGVRLATVPFERAKKEPGK